MFRVPPSQLFANLGVRLIPKAGQVFGDLLRSVIWSQQVQLDRDSAIRSALDDFSIDGATPAFSVHCCIPNGYSLFSLLSKPDPVRYSSEFSYSTSAQVLGDPRLDYWMRPIARQLHWQEDFCVNGTARIPGFAIRRWLFRFDDWGLA